MDKSIQTGKTSPPSGIMGTIILLFLLFLIGCTHNTKNELNGNSTITDCFTREEIKGLTKLLDFFNEQICVTQGIDKKEIIECYDSFIERMTEAVEAGDIDIKIPFEKQQKIYHQIDDSLFYQIWIFHKSWGRNSPDTLKCIDYRLDGKYVKFLKVLGEDYEMVKNYSESLEFAYVLSPSMVADIFMIKEHFHYDLKDIRLRLVVAIHYLTMNDQYERKEKY